MLYDLYSVSLAKVSTSQALLCMNFKYTMYCATLKVTGKDVAAGAFTKIGKTCSPSKVAAAILTSTSALACYDGSWDPNRHWCRNLVCTPLTLAFATGNGKVTAGAEKLMRSDNTAISGEGEGSSES